MLTGRCTPVRGLNSFFRFVCNVQKATFHFATRLLRKPHEKDRQKDQQSSTRGLCILRASHATWVPSARMMALPIRCCIVAHHFCPKRTYYRDVLNCFVSSQVGRALIDALEKVQASATRHCAGPVRLLEQWTVNRKTSHGSLNREELSSIQQHRQ